MTTDFTPEAPHTDYECTIHVRCTKELFQTIRELLETSVPEDKDQAQAKDFLYHEVEDVINWIAQNEKYYK